LGAPLIGINNRDLRDLSVDLSTTERLAHMAPDRLIVSESGIARRDDVRRLSPHADGFLVGSGLMRAEDPAHAARELIFGRVKLCGLNRADDFAEARPAAFAGLIFVPDSPRQLTRQQALPLAELARDLGVRPVGVFRDLARDAVVEIAALHDLHAVQLHGREDADYTRALRAQLPERCEIWRAVSVGRDPLVGEGCDRLVFDNGGGGSGRTFDWTAIRDHPDLGRAIVAGGIGPHNAREAERLGGYAIDVGSALDAAPGRKSAAKMRALFDTLRPASRELARKCA